jgi:dienelactone hydrolase
VTTRNETLTYRADGLDMCAELFIDDAVSGPRPGVLVFPELTGPGEHAKSSATRLAELGYAALACDLHGNGQLITDPEILMPMFQPLRDSPERIRARAKGGLVALLAHPDVDPAKMAAIGYCFGGTMALELVRGKAALSGIVGFHCGLGSANPGAGGFTGKVLICIGADDPSIGADMRVAFEQEMRDAGIDWRMHLYGGVVHSFTNPNADKLGLPDFARYDPAADARSWVEMRAFLDDAFAA